MGAHSPWWRRDVSPPNLQFVLPQVVPVLIAPTAGFRQRPTGVERRPVQARRWSGRGTATDRGGWLRPSVRRSTALGSPIPPRAPTRRWIHVTKEGFGSGASHFTYAERSLTSNASHASTRSDSEALDSMACSNSASTIAGLWRSGHPLSRDSLSHVGRNVVLAARVTSPARASGLLSGMLHGSRCASTLGRPAADADDQRPHHGAVPGGEPRFTLGAVEMPDPLTQGLSILWRQPAQAAVIQERRPDEETITRAILDGHPVEMGRQSNSVAAPTHRTTICCRGSSVRRANRRRRVSSTRSVARSMARRARSPWSSASKWSCWVRQRM